MTQAAKNQAAPTKRVVFTMGGKGGVGWAHEAYVDDLDLAVRKPE